MSHTKITMQDRLMAHTLAFGSTVGQFMPSIRDRIIASDSTPIVPIRWRFDGMPRAAVANWIDVPGRKEHGRTPRNYNETALLAADYAEIEDARNIYGDVRPAVAYSIGEAVMVGAFPDGIEFKQMNAEAVVGMRIGKGVLRASMGLWQPRTNTYLPTVSPVRLYGRLETSGVPLSIPVV